MLARACSVAAKDLVRGGGSGGAAARRRRKGAVLHSLSIGVFSALGHCARPRARRRRARTRRRDSSRAPVAAFRVPRPGCRCLSWMLRTAVRPRVPRSRVSHRELGRCKCCPREKALGQSSLVPGCPGCRRGFCPMPHLEARLAQKHAHVTGTQAVTSPKPSNKDA